MTRLLPLFLLAAVACTPASSLTDDPAVDEPSAEADPDPTVDDGTSEGPNSHDDGGDEPDAPACPAGVTCIDQFPWSGAGDTTGGTRQFDGYSCAPSTDESGPEQLYRLDLPEDGFVALTLDGLPAGVDVDVHLLASRDASDCLDRGHWVAGSWLEAGSYWVVVDSWVSGATEYDGAYTLTVGHTTEADLTASGVSAEVASAALYAFDAAWQDGETSRFEYGLIDFSLPSTQRRLWVFDLSLGDLRYHELVTHGEASTDPADRRMAKYFSNVDGSHKSSLGMMRAAETYTGSKGWSMRLDGLEPGTNDAVRSRAIVMHPATYATQSFVDANGYLGRSWGCPAMDPAISDAVIGTLTGGALVFSWYPDPAWTSPFLQGWSP